MTVGQYGTRQLLELLAQVSVARPTCGKPDEAAVSLTVDKPCSSMVNRAASRIHKVEALTRRAF